MKSSKKSREDLFHMGFQALVKTLGPAKATRFVIEFIPGHGDSVKDIRAIRERTTWRDLWAMVGHSKAA